MPIKETEVKFELIPYGIVQTLIVAFAASILGISFIVLAILFRTYQMYWILYILAGITFLVIIYFTIRRILKIRSGSLDIFTIDVEGVRVHNQKEGIMKNLNWDEIERITVQRDNYSGDEYTSDAAESIVISGKSDCYLFLVNWKYNAGIL